ncbi:MAG: hypothetical protein E7174_02120 [Firmicutes bacterium]|nr:hypothetical protein [Bacillota bacterium]
MNGYIDLGIELRVKETTEQTYSKAILVAVKGMPATGQAGGTVEITTSSDPTKVYVADRPDTGDMDFTYNYTESNLSNVQEVCDNSTKDILIKLPDGTGVEYKGTLQTWINEVSVGSAIECTLHTVPSVAPTYLTSSEVSTKIATN